MSDSKFKEMGLEFHHEQANSEVILWSYIRKINLKFGNSRIKSPRVETTVRDKLCNQAHMANSGR